MIGVTRLARLASNASYSSNASPSSKASPSRLASSSRLASPSSNASHSRLARLASLASLLLALLTSCQIQPPLHLPDNGQDVEAALPAVKLTLDLLWEYQLRIDSVSGEIIDSTYNWRDEFFYGWDSQDDMIFGTWNIVEPTVFNIRRYYTEDIPAGKHTYVNEHQIEGTSLIARYKFGYYDILAWNEVTTLDGVQSLHFDEETTKEYVTAYTNQSMNQARRARRQQYAYYQPEFLFGGYSQGVYISENIEDYDYYDEDLKAYVKNLDMALDPRTYIYLTQVILRHNNGRVSDIEGTASLEGMASKTNVNTGVTGDDEVAVSYSQRMKRNVSWNGENVDIIGGRLFTFGLCGQNPSRSSRATARSTDIRNYIDVGVTFNNGKDSTLVFDVTDQIHKRYKGGIITVVVDVDTLKIPKLGDGSAFDAVIEDYEEVLDTFSMAKRGVASEASESSESSQSSESSRSSLARSARHARNASHASLASHARNASPPSQPSPASPPSQPRKNY